MPPFDGNPLEAAPDSLAGAKQALEERKLPLTEENIFLVAAAIIPGKNMDLNEGIRLLTGKPKIVLPLKKKEEPAAETAAPAPAPGAAPFTAPITTTCTVTEGGADRKFRITIEPPSDTASSLGSEPAQTAAPADGTPVYSPFQGKTELVEIKVKVGDAVKEGEVVAAVEAMKAKHDVKAPCAGTVASIDAEIGADIAAGQSILTIGA
jgi:biotin carboxyl carrier protein